MTDSPRRHRKKSSAARGSLSGLDVWLVGTVLASALPFAIAGMLLVFSDVNESRSKWEEVFGGGDAYPITTALAMQALYEVSETQIRATERGLKKFVVGAGLLTLAVAASLYGFTKFQIFDGSWSERDQTITGNTAWVFLSLTLLLTAGSAWLRRGVESGRRGG